LPYFLARDRLLLKETVMVEATVRKTYKYKLDPTPTQVAVLGQTLRLCHHLYNVALEHRKTAWERRQVSINRFQQEADLKDIRAEFPEYAALHSHLLQDVIAQLDRAFQAFFRRVKAGQKAGYPCFRGAARYTSFTYKEYSNGVRVDEHGRLVIAKIGALHVRWGTGPRHRPLVGTPKTVTITREADGWYVGFSCAAVPIQPQSATGQETGIDLGLESFATVADGSQIANPRLFRVAEMRLKRAQRRVSRRKRGSRRRHKAVRLLARAHQGVRRARRDFHHRAALALLQQYDTIYHEDLQTANMVQNHHLAKSISDAGWGQFLTILTAKAAYAGRRVVAVPPAYTSQACSGCGVVVYKGLSARWHLCPVCGTSLHRDHNAAKNIERAGQALRGAVA
jgi:putative transposase